MVFSAFIFSALICFAIVIFLVSYFKKTNLLDIPNNRSSHSSPVPKAGGLGFVIAFSFIAILYYKDLSYSPQIIITIVVTSVAIAILGFFDDKFELSAKLRFIIHIVCSTVLVLSLDFPDSFLIFSASFEINWFLKILFVIYLVWFINLYNFMDGTDGIAATQSILSLVLMIFVIGIERSFAESNIYLILLSTLFMFLIFNFPPAKIFMGDTGSGYLGFLMGVFPLIYLNEPKIFWIWLISLSPFIVDATYTLLIRLIQNKTFYEAHRTHAYQKVAIAHNSHLKLIKLFLFLYLIVITPLSLMVFFDVLLGEVGLLIAILLLVIIENKFKAGYDQ